MKEIVFARDIKEFSDLERYINSSELISQVRQEIMHGDVYILKRFIDEGLIKRLKSYLIGIGRGSLPNYRAIEQGSPNFHRINYGDDRAYVKGCFHQFVFFIPGIKIYLTCMRCLSLFINLKT